MANKILAYILILDLVIGFFLGISIGIKESPLLGTLISMLCLSTFCLLFLRRIKVTRWILKA